MRAGAPPAGSRAAFVCRASPSLALIKYWGKLEGGRMLPATPSLGVCLGSLSTTTRAEASFDGADELHIGEAAQPIGRYSEFFAEMRRALRAELGFRVTSRNDFPTSSGLASSSSGFAALAFAAARAGEALLGGGRRPLSHAEISRIARVGSISAARAVFGGFSLLPARARAARALYGEGHWPELRVLVAAVTLEEKPLSSRAAMELSRSTSIYHRSWVGGAGAELAPSLEALGRRDLEALGLSMRRSYLRMFGTMLACDPPLIYWLPGSLELIRECEAMRREGLEVWETMDAGPQVKMLCLARDAPRIVERVWATGAAAAVIESRVGGAPEVGAAESA